MTLLRRLLHWHRWGPMYGLLPDGTYGNVCSRCGAMRYYTLEEDAMGAYWMRVTPSRGLGRG